MRSALAEQRMDVVRDEIGDVRAGPGSSPLKRAIWRRAASALGMACGGIGLVEEHLALQVALLDEIAVDEDERADAGARQQRRGGGSGGSAADDRDGRGGEALLSRFADRREEHLARVAIGIRARREVSFGNSVGALHCV